MIIPNYIVFDLETGGLSPDKNPVTEIAAIGIDGETLKEIGRFESMIKPYPEINGNKEYGAKAIEITGLSPEQLMQRGEDSKKVLEGFSVFCKEMKAKKRPKVVGVGHNVEFDEKFLTSFYVDHGKNLEDVLDLKHAFDTMWLAMLKYNEKGSIKNHTLGVVCDATGVSLNNAHRAMNDVEATAELFISFSKLLKGEGTVSKEAAKSFRETFNF